MQVKNNSLSSISSSYSDYYQYLFHELKLLNLSHLKELRSRQSTKKGEAKGFFISEEEVINILNSFPETDFIPSDSSEIESINSLIEKVSKDTALRLSNTENNSNFPLVKLARIFGLNPLELTILLLAFAPEIDKRYEKVYAYFNDDLSKKAPSVSLALDLLFNNLKDKLNGLQFFSPQAPLLHFNLIRFIDTEEESSSLNRRFILDEGIKRFIAGDRGFCSNLSGIAQLHYSGRTIPDDNIREYVMKKIIQLLTKEKEKDYGNPVFWLYGKAKEDKKATALAIGEKFKLPVLVADLENIFFEADQKSILQNLFRESALQSALVFLGGGERLYGEGEKSEFLRNTLLRTIRDYPGITFISAESLWIPEYIEGKYLWYPFEFNLPGYVERRKIWTNMLNGNHFSEKDIEALSARFNFSQSQIRKAVLYAKQFLNGDQLNLESICKACQIQSHQRLSIYSSKVTPHFIWEDIVLPEDKINHLREICNYIKNKHIVYYKWGFEKKLALGKGLNILFSGPSGTGKTMAADIVANELKLDMYKTDLSAVVSKYIGETEKNLSQIFKETSSGNIILFFDEADALFGKRSEIKDAHDRYANIEINYLLQKMEEHEGIVILATNLSKNIDEAFLRRMHFTVEFPFPEGKQRRLIWKKIFPLDTPLDRDIDREFLSEKLNLAGGNIKNIALTAAFYAAEESSGVQMRHIILAVKRELQKMGRLCIKGDFGKYSELLEARSKE